GHVDLITEVQDQWKAFQLAKKSFDELSAESVRLKGEYDFIKFQLDEIEKAGFQQNEQEMLESSLKVSEHGEDIKSRLNQLLNMLDQSESSAQSVMSESINLLQHIRSYAPAYENLYQRLESLRIELKDILNEVRAEEEKIEFEPGKTKQLQSRLDLLYSL